ncbi:bifunctional copper resistance protein CopD/cytochrome c oxidase assembly protein [Mycolicibacterium fluoranthenivorans]|jgi:putative copper resistance protein D|uniref:Bifunctional copper resistance protein CopD/cytochrome c oxidase assembly protein n=1 Tax=Mycolicibacterium fluoranthenivorans TaxID=258505 RepID=A0A7G8PBF4_9MYCO|nr:cytochrome c oxidase assembly protein [Mycolicibacterium fluoranthenivorans]QNJ91670.1 bifunctional copper resistance protein CopD/cytochrome c oxidase assembly protein [Mycolicibacterium fluoranthenivorans]
MTTTAPRVHTGTVWPVLFGVAVLAGAVAAGLGGLSLADALTATGLPDPGPVTTYGLPFVRAAGEIAAAVAVGSFLLAAFLVPPQSSGVLDVAGYRALRTGTVASGIWTVSAVLLVPLTVSDITGQPLASRLSVADIWSVAGLVETAGTWRWTALFAAIVTVVSIPVLRWSWTPLLCAGSVFTLVPLALSGHSSAGGSHDLATNSLFIHLVAGVVWAGGLLAVWALAFRGGAHTDLAARRFSAIALWCFVAMGFSGVINAFVRVRPADLLHSSYGWLVVGKVVALLVLGVLGFLQRRRAVGALAADPENRRPLIQLALVESLVFGLTFGIAVALGRTPPPPPPVFNPSVTAVQIGYDLAGPPTVARILFDWRFDLIFGTAAILFAAVYVAGVIRLRRRGDAWPVGRTAAWLCGCAVLLFATSSGLGRYMPAMFSMHMGAHMLLSMLSPVLLVLGAPVTLALRALPTAGRDAPPGMREWLLAALHSRVSQLLTNPFVATALFVGGFYGLYFGGIFDAVAGIHAAHVAMNLHFLLSGYLFYWVVIGIDPTPRPIPSLAKLGMVFGSLPLHAFFGVVLMGTQTVMAEGFYKSLQLYWHTDLLGDQRLGGGIAWSAGEVPLVLVMLALLIQWRRSDNRTAKRLDRAADRDDDADLAAYNAMLSKLAEREQHQG